MVKNLIQILNRVSARIGTRFIIILIGLTVISTLAGSIWLITLMKPGTSTVQTTRKGDCASCHAEIQLSWHKGAHGDSQSKNALAKGSNCLACHKNTSEISTNANDVKPSFTDFWVKEGMPNDCPSCHVTGYNKATNTWKSDGISCEVCHGIIPEDHPNAVVPIDKSGENCRTCHTSARFDWGKWEDSVHFKNSISCVDCHNPHTTSLKIAGTTTHGVPSELCGNCHKKLADSSEHSTHAKVGITCIECHLGEPKGNDDFHQISDHDFKPKIETCNKCHLSQMHLASASTENTGLRALSHAKAGAGKNPSPLVESRSGIFFNPLAFIAAVMLIGLVAGAVLRKLFPL